MSSELNKEKKRLYYKLNKERFKLYYQKNRLLKNDKTNNSAHRNIINRYRRMYYYNKKKPSSLPPFDPTLFSFTIFI